MTVLSQTVIAKLQDLSPADLERVLRFVDTLTATPPAPSLVPPAIPEEADEEARPWRGTLGIDFPRRDETPVALPAEPLAPRDQPFDILWDPNRHDD